MSVDIGPIIGGRRLDSPLILGPFDALVNADVLCRCFEICGDTLGGVVTKSTTIAPRAGYPEPKVARFGHGLLVASGNCNPGIDRMIREVERFRERLGTSFLLGSIVSDPDNPGISLADEYCQLAAAYARAGVDGLELNLSCPHLDPEENERTIVPAQDPERVGHLVRAVKSALQKAGCPNCLVVPKLTGWNCDPVEVARAAEQAGADAVTVSNLFPGTGYATGLEPDSPGTIRPRKPGEYLVAHGKGAYSGEAMHSAVLLFIESLRRHTAVPIIGSGGCATNLDSLVQTFMAGASVVEAVTPFYFHEIDGMDALRGVERLVEELRRYLQQLGLENPQALYRLRTRSHSS